MGSSSQDTQSPKQDIHPPKIDEAKKQVHKHEKTQLDRELEDTFPASDPPSMTEPHKHLGSGKKPGEADKSAETSKTSENPTQ